MSLVNKQNRKIQEQTISSTLIDNRGLTRKMFKRQRGDQSYSNESRRSYSKTKRQRESIQMKGPSFIRVPLQLLPSMTQIQQSVPLSINQQSNRLSHLGKKPSGNSSMGTINILQKRVLNLQNQLQAQTQQIQAMQKQYSKKRQQFIELQIKYKSLQTSHLNNVKQKQNIQQEFKKVLIENKKLIQDKEALNKKIGFLQKVQFSSDTKNIQSLRQTHLQGQLETAKNKLNNSKSQIQQLLERQIIEIRQQLFITKKLAQSLQISNDCLQKKADQAYYLINQDENYTALKSKYRKFLSQFKELKKSYDIIQKQNTIMKSRLKGTLHQDMSLQLSMFSIIH